MRADGQAEEAIRNFRSAYERFVSGDEAVIRSADLEPAGDVPALDELPDPDRPDALKQFAVIKLNGGLATTMGLSRPKSLLEVREGHSFLDIIIGQTLILRQQFDLQLPLLLMDSEATQRDTLAALEQHPELAVDELPPHFMQSMIPKLDADTRAPVSWSENPSLEWAPPGHGDVYGALRRSGLLESLLERGIRYAMISNSDNLGSTLDPRIAEFVAREEIPFLMEVVEGTEADRKGGHIARRKADGQLVLRETAQTPPEDEESFRDYRHWRYYNTNNLWVDLQALKDLQAADPAAPELPLIVNRKTVDPRDKASTPVIQLETAMGAAVGSIPGARAVQVPRSRFAPVKTTNDLLVVWSDAYELGDDGRMTPTFDGPGPIVTLDDDHYKLVPDFEQRFPAGAPSLRRCTRLQVEGDVTFGADVVVEGDVHVEGPRRVPDGEILRG
jgi:UTP--glucose-1-phosphate uridylyltransferase